MPSFPDHWRRTTPISLALLPLAALFWVASSTRRAFYRLGVFKSHSVAVPVIVVGNLVVGGAGKTPLVLALASYLRERGHRPGIVSRGYGGTDGDRATEVKASDDPRRAGDEAVMLASNGASPVWIGRKRFHAAEGLLNAHPECDLILADDGLQHYALARDLEILVEDERGAGNGWLLPAGPLREPASRRVDAIVQNGAASEPVARLRNGSPVFSMQLTFRDIREVHQPETTVDVEALRGRRLHAVAGIGNPERFFRLIEKIGLRAIPHSFADHHRFTQRDLEIEDCDAILMTEKDAVKCRSLHRPTACTWYAVSVRGVLDPSFYDFILTRLRGAPSGRTTA